MFYLPKWIYEAAPFIYLIAGGAAMFGMDSRLGRLSGLLLISAAIMIIVLRQQLRKAPRHEREHPEQNRRAVTFQYKNG